MQEIRGRERVAPPMDGRLEERELDMTAEPFVLRLTNSGGRLGVEPSNRASEWVDAHGRRYRATLRVVKEKPRSGDSSPR